MLAKLRASAGLLRFLMNLWPPFLFSGIHVDAIAPDFRSVRVSLRQRIFNRNYVGSHFGGSLFAMVDPFFMLMVMRNLGNHYYVWDLRGEIDFCTPGHGQVWADLKIDQALIDSITQATASGEKFQKRFEVSIINQENKVVAHVVKTLYVRLKPSYRPRGNDSEA